MARSLCLVRDGHHERAVQGIAAILSKDLKLPMPERVTVYVYS